jgi:hypothetical protein
MADVERRKELRKRKNGAKIQVIRGNGSRGINVLNSVTSKDLKIGAIYCCLITERPAQLLTQYNKYMYTYQASMAGKSAANLIEAGEGATVLTATRVLAKPNPYTSWLSTCRACRTWRIDGWLRNSNEGETRAAIALCDTSKEMVLRKKRHEESV